MKPRATKTPTTWPPWALRGAQGETLSRAAFPGSKRLFQAMDKDRDGTLTRAEAVAYRQQGIALMERIRWLEERASEARIPGELWQLLFREAEACFHGGRYDDLPALFEQLKSRLQAARAARRGDKGSRERREQERRERMERRQREDD